MRQLFLSNLNFLPNYKITFNAASAIRRVGREGHVDHMNNFARTWVTAFCGVFTSLLVLIANMLVEHFTGHNVYSFSIWFILPVGSFALGLAAASGFYYGSVFLKQRAGSLLFMLISVTAAISVFLMYWLEYKLAIVGEGIRIADMMSFPLYMENLLTTAHLKSMKSGADSGEIGSFGYWHAAILAAGFWLGQLSIFMMIRNKPCCLHCKGYTKPLGKREKLFTGPIGATAYFEEQAKLPVDGHEFATLLRAEGNSDRLEAGAVKIEISLLCCPMCKAQQLQEILYQYRDSEWVGMNKGDPSNLRQLPNGVDLAPVFQK